MNPPKLSKRLLAAASFVREGSFVADVGTDHAYLPIYLYLEGRIRGAIASDINKGPVQTAKANVASYKLKKKITVLHTDGLHRVEVLSPDDIIICGMGGELITNILSGVGWIRDRRIRLILQPMTHADTLRRYLGREGFSIVGERIVKDEKIYQIICAEYTGRVREYSNVELIFGKRNLKERSDTLMEYAEFVRGVFIKRRDGKLASGADASLEEEMLAEIDKILGNT